MFSHRDSSIYRSAHQTFSSRIWTRPSITRHCMTFFSAFGGILSCKVATDGSGLSKRCIRVCSVCDSSVNSDCLLLFMQYLAYT